MPPTRRKGTAPITRQSDRNETFRKRSEGLIKKSFVLTSLTGASVALIALPTEAINREVHYFGSPSVAEPFFKFLHQRCETGIPDEERAYLTMKCQGLLSSLDKSKDNAGARHGSRVKAEAGKDSKKNFETSHDSVLVFPEDGADHVECSTLEADLATTGNPTQSSFDFDDMDWAFNGINELLPESIIQEALGYPTQNFENFRGT